MLKVVVIDIVPPKTSPYEVNVRKYELESLVQTYGGVVIVATYQKKMMPDYQSYVGKGKLEEMIEYMKEHKADVLIIGNILKPRQIYHINEELRRESKDLGYLMTCRDRVDLILKIFDQHAQSAEAKLQIELASIKHMGPRIFGMGMELSRQGGGIGTKGIGETNTEIMKRHLQERRLVLEKKLIEYEKMRKSARERRKKNNMFTVGIVGYTNAGKSSLFTRLSKKDVLSEDKLFATLGTTASKTYIPHPTEDHNNKDHTSFGTEILLHDTIGFIRDLPPQLIKAFTSTLEDSIETDLLLHVIDGSDPEWIKKIAIVDTILAEIGANQQRILVINKIDLLEDADKMKIIGAGKELQENYAEQILVSAHSGVGIEDLQTKILQFIT